MKLFRTAAVGAAVALTLTLTACGGGDGDGPATSSTPASAATSSASTAAATPDAAGLNSILALAVDPAVQATEKVNTVQGGDVSPELFDVMAASQSESGARFEVIDPVLPGYTANSVLATVKLVLPDRPEQVVDGVEFVHEDQVWKLSTTWACTLVQNVSPEKLPPSCMSLGITPPAPAPEAPVNAN